MCVWALPGMLEKVSVHPSAGHLAPLLLGHLRTQTEEDLPRNAASSTGHRFDHRGAVTAAQCTQAPHGRHPRIISISEQQLETHAPAQG
jgi:hypothetical protein